MLRIPRLSLILLIATAACAASPKPATQAAAPSKNLSILSREEIESRGLGERTLYDAIRRLRPTYLQNRGDWGPLQVSLDGAPVTGVGDINTLMVAQISEVRYLTPAGAAQMFGTSASMGPVLLVKRR